MKTESNKKQAPMFFGFAPEEIEAYSFTLSTRLRARSANHEQAAKKVPLEKIAATITRPKSPESLETRPKLDSFTTREMGWSSAAVLNHSAPNVQNPLDSSALRHAPNRDARRYQYDDRTCYICYQQYMYEAYYVSGPSICIRPSRSTVNDTQAIHRMPLSRHMVSTTGFIAPRKVFERGPPVYPQNNPSIVAQVWNIPFQQYATPPARPPTPTKLELYSSKSTHPWMRNWDRKSPKARRSKNPNIFEEALNIFLALEMKRAKVCEAQQQQLEPEDESCPICGDPYDDYYEDSDNHFRAKTSCGHIMGYNCLEIWHLVKARKTRWGMIRWSRCPMCRAETTAVYHLQSMAQIQEAEQQKLRRKIFLTHEKIANSIKGPIQWIVDSELTKERNLTIAAAIVARIFWDYWADDEPGLAREAVKDVTEITKELIKFYAIRDAPATQRFLGNTLGRASRWSFTETDQAMKDFLDLFLLFMAWPSEAEEFEEYCREVENQEGQQGSSWIDWKEDPSRDPAEDTLRQLGSSSSSDPDDEELVPLPIDDLRHESDDSEPEYDYGIDDGESDWESDWESESAEVS